MVEALYPERGTPRSPRAWSDSRVSPRAGREHHHAALWRQSVPVVAPTRASGASPSPATIPSAGAGGAVLSACTVPWLRHPLQSPGARLAGCRRRHPGLGAGGHGRGRGAPSDRGAYDDDSRASGPGASETAQSLSGSCAGFRLMTAPAPAERQSDVSGRRLATDEIHLWHSDLAMEGHRLAQLASYLDQDERA